MTKSLTLTFDNGPFADVTPQVLRVLEEKEVLATFFMLGERLALPDGRPLAQSVLAAGHWIGNHTWSHSTYRWAVSRLGMRSSSAKFAGLKH